MTTKDQKRIAELELELKEARYVAGFLQQRLDWIRSQRENIIFLLDTRTFQEHLDAGGEASDWEGFGKGIG